jgi:tetratricopeptide (TPR) repeat protein
VISANRAKTEIDHTHTEGTLRSASWFNDSQKEFRRALVPREARNRPLGAARAADAAALARRAGSRAQKLARVADRSPVEKFLRRWMDQSLATDVGRIKSEFGRSFSIAARVSVDMDCFEEGERAAKRAIAHDAHSPPMLDLFPHYGPIVREVEQLLLRHLRLLRGRPDDAPSRAAVVLCHLALGAFPSALEELAKCADVGDPAFLFAAGVIHGYFAHADAARRALERLCALAPAFDGVRDLQLRLAFLERAAKGYDAALDRLTALARAPPIGLRSEDIDFQVAFTMELMRNWDAAFRRYQALQARFPRVAPVTEHLCLYVYLRSRDGDLAPAKAALAAGLRAHAHDPVLTLIAAWIATRERDLERAHDSYRACLPYYRESPYFWCALGAVYYHTQQSQDAVVAFQRALFLKNNLPEAWLNIGLISEEASDFAGALKIYQTGKSHCPDEKEFDERMDTLRSQRAGHRKYGVGNALISVDESLCVMPPPEQFAMDYVRSVPKLPPEAIGSAMERAKFGELATVPKSLFG